MNLPEQFSIHWKKRYGNILIHNTRLLIAVSGGMDSIVLTDLIFNAGFTFDIAHCNFRLRGAESDRDEQFVKELAERYNIPFHVKQFDTEQYATEHKLGIQEAARILRYQWFEELLAAYDDEKKSFIVTAHHADDNVETVLFHIFRGTGMSGLHGILPRQGNIIRPLLFAKREAIAAYAAEKQLSWVEDSSNASVKYTRNYIRHEILPVIANAFPNVADNISQNIERWQEGEALYRQAIDLHIKKLCEVKGNEVHIPVLKLQRSTPLNSIVYEIIKSYGFTAAQTEEVTGLLESESGKYVASPSHRILRNRKWLIISPVATETAANIVIETGTKQIGFANGSLSIEMTGDATLATSDHIATIDASLLTFPLLLRKWKQGDYFYPLGMRKKKKISRFLIDRKVSMTDKEKVWVLESNKRIVWVIGYRVDDRFRITSSTKEVARITFRYP